MSNSRENVLAQLNAGDRVEVLMKKDSHLMNRIGRFNKLHIIEYESTRLEFLVVEEELVDQNKESIWFISLKFVEEVRKLHFRVCQDFCVNSFPSNPPEGGFGVSNVSSC